MVKYPKHTGGSELRKRKDDSKEAGRIHIGMRGSAQGKVARCVAAPGKCPLTANEDSMHFFNEKDMQTFYSFTAENKYSNKESKFKDSMTNREKLYVLLNDPETPDEVIDAIAATVIGTFEQEKKLAMHPNSGILSLDYLRENANYGEVKHTAEQKKNIQACIKAIESGKIKAGSINSKEILDVAISQRTLKKEIGGKEKAIKKIESDRTRLINGLCKSFRDSEYEKYYNEFNLNETKDKTKAALITVKLLKDEKHEVSKKVPQVTSAGDKEFYEQTAKANNVNMQKFEEFISFPKGAENYISDEDYNKLASSLENGIQAVNFLRSYRDDNKFSTPVIANMVAKTDKKKIDKLMLGLMARIRHNKGHTFYS